MYQPASSERGTLRHKLAQLIFVRIGSNLPPVRTVEQDAERIARLLETEPLGGLILFNGSWESTPATLERLQDSRRSPLLIGADLERGAGQQLHGLPLFPHAMAFGVGRGDDYSRASGMVEEFAEITAVAMRQAGVHINFAPVADVNNEPRNPIIATRAFATDPRRASELAAAFVRGCKAAGVLSAAKHFPGHGNTHEDSHHALPTVDASRERLAECELAPFRAAIAAGVPLIMSAHVCYPRLDGSGAPATLSRPILVDLLRNELAFDGAVVSDSLLMEGVKSQATDEGELAVRALNAGVDVLLDVAEPTTTLDALERAVGDGRVAEPRVDEALQRVIHLHHLAFGESASAGVDAAQRPNNLEAKTAQLAAAVARQAVVTVADCENLTPFNPDRSLCAILVKPFETVLDPPQQPLAAALAQVFPHLAYYELIPSSSHEQLQSAASAARSADQLLVAMIVKPAAWHAFGLPADLHDWVDRVVNSRDAVLACLGSPEGLRPFKAPVTICTFSDVAASQTALAEALSGGVNGGRG